MSVIRCRCAPTTDLVGAIERMVHVEELRPELCSLDCGSFNYGAGNDVYISTAAMIRTMAERMLALGVKPELEVFDFGHLRLATTLVDAGIVAAPLCSSSRSACAGVRPPTRARCCICATELPPDAVWLAFGPGALQMPMAAQSVLLGGHVRVGLEDNLHRRRGVFGTNRELVEDAVHLVETLGARPATPSEARELLGLPAAPPR